MMSKEKKLADIAKDITQNLSCPLKDNAQNLVFGKGNPRADILFIGEAPGAKEDECGLPFMGAAGKRLDKMLQTVGLTLDDCYIANILKYRPPKNRDPTYDEIMNHTPFLLKQIDVIKPKIIIPLGTYATAFVLAGFNAEKKAMKQIEPISKTHGVVHERKLGKQTITVIPLYHPAALIYRPKLQIEMEADLSVAKKLMEKKK